MNRNIALSLAFAVFFGVELLSAQEIPREPEPQRQKAEGGSRTEMLRLVVRSAFRGAGDIPDSILESCFPPDKPRESHVSAALEVGNALLKEDSSELVYDNETGGRVPKRELSLRVLAGVMGRLKHPEFLPWLYEQAISSPAAKVREKAAVAYVEIAGIDVLPFLHEFVAAHPDDSLPVVEAFTRQIGDGDMDKPESIPASVFLLKYLQWTASPEAALRIDQFLCGKLPGYTNSLQRAQVSARFYNIPDVRYLDVFNPVKERFDNGNLDEWIDLNHRFSELNKGWIPPRQPVKATPAANGMAPSSNADPRRHPHDLDEAVEILLLSKISDQDLMAFDAYVVTNDLPRSEVVDAVIRTAERHLGRDAPDESCRAWSLITQMGNRDFLPYLDRKSRSRNSIHALQATEAYVRIAGIDAAIFLREKLRISRVRGGHREGWEPVFSAFFNAIELAKPQQVPQRELDVAFMVLIEHVMQVDDAWEADRLDNWLCARLPEYASSIQRMRMINSLADHPNPFVSNPFVAKRLACLGRFQGNHDDLEGRYPWLARLRDVERRAFKSQGDLLAFKRACESAWKEGLAWHEVRIPRVLLRGNMDFHAFARSIQSVLADSYRVNVHIQSASPRPPFLYVGMCNASMHDFIKVVCELSGILPLFTDKALFLFDQYQDWEEEAVFVARGKVTLPAGEAMPERIRVRRWMEENATLATPTSILPEITSSINTNGEYVCWYAYKRVLSGIVLHQDCLRITPDSKTTNLPSTHRLRFEIGKLPPFEHVFEADFHKPFHLFNFRYSGNSWAVEDGDATATGVKE